MGEIQGEICRILLVDDHKLLMEGVRSLLAPYGHLRVVGMLGLALPTNIIQTCLGATILGIAVLLLLSKNSVRPVVTTQDAVGMFITYGIVRRLGGEITVDSTEGQGSTISITLPLTPPDVAMEV